MVIWLWQPIREGKVGCEEQEICIRKWGPWVSEKS